MYFIIFNIIFLLIYYFKVRDYSAALQTHDTETLIQLFQHITLAFTSLKENLNAIACSFWLTYIQYLENIDHPLWHVLLSNPQCFNEVICETSLSFLSSQMENHPQNGNFEVCDELWKRSSFDREKNNKLHKFLKIEKYHTVTDLINDKKEISLIQGSIPLLFDDIINNEKCIYPEYKNCMYKSII